MNPWLIQLKKYSLSLLILFLLLLATVYYFYWHLKPFTQNAFVFANTRAVSMLVAGYLEQIHVRNNQFVHKGDPLFTTYREPYRLEVKRLESELAGARAKWNSLLEKNRSAEADIRARQAELANNRYLSERADDMYRSEAVSQAYAETRLRARQTAEAKLESARRISAALRHECQAAQHAIHALESQLQLNRIWLKQTIVRALSDGYVTNMTLSPGGYYRPGEILCGFIDSSAWYVQANFKENELSELRTGLPAKIWLWQYPGRLFSGIVEEIGWGVERRRSSNSTGVPIVEKENEWFLLPQRFPVQIRLIELPPDLFLHVGGSAYVELDIPSHPIRQFFWELFLVSQRSKHEN